MKRYLYLLIILISQTIFAQSEEEELFAGELHIKFINKPLTWGFTVKIQALSTVWDQYHEITQTFSGGDTTYTSLDYPEPEYHASDLDWDNQGWEPVLSLGLYELSIWEGTNKLTWVYLDYRTSEFPCDFWSCNPDLFLYYDVTNKILEFYTPNIGEVTNGEYYALWDLKESIEPYTLGLENYWDNSLVLIPALNGSPKIIWGPYDLTNAEEFRIYRAVTNDTYPPQTPIFSCIDTVSASTFSYIDENYSLGGPFLLHYYVTVAHQPFTEDPELIESQPSNTVISSGSMQKSSHLNTQHEILFGLSQNYPNPFNPTTTITYQIPISGNVLLRIFDFLGREVAVLLDEHKETGKHTIEFNATDFTSGVYFYNLTSGRYSETRKLIVLK